MRDLIYFILRKQSPLMLSYIYCSKCWPYCTVLYCALLQDLDCMNKLIYIHFAGRRKNIVRTTYGHTAVFIVLVQYSTVTRLDDAARNTYYRSCTFVNFVPLYFRCKPILPRIGSERYRYIYILQALASMQSIFVLCCFIPKVEYFFSLLDHNWRCRARPLSSFP